MSPEPLSSHKSSDRSFPYNLLFIAAILALLVPLITHAILGSYTRYIADDWCTAATVHSQGLIQAQCTWYMNWSGRYTFTFSVSLIELIGIKLVPYLPTLALGLWLAVTTWAVYQFRVWGSGSFAILFSLLIASLLIITVLEIIPNVHQSLYWQTGMLTYIAPLIFATIIIGIFTRNLRRAIAHRLRGSTLVLAVLAAIAGGFSEMYVAMQTTAFLIAIVIFLTISSDDRKRPTTTLLVAGLLGSIVSMAMIFFAPGNEIRQALTPDSPGLFSVIGSSLNFALRFIGKSILFSPLPTSLALFIPALITFTLPLNGGGSGDIHPRLNQRRLFSFLLLSPVVAYLLIASSMAPSVYGVSAFPEDRTLTIPQFILTSTIIFWGSVGGLTLKKRSSWIMKHKTRITVIGCCLVAVLLVLGPLLSANRNFTQVPTLRAYANRWDARDREIRAAQKSGATQIAVPALGFTGGLADIKDDPDYWVNRCFAGYYGLESVEAE
jgi:hypothetical protein